MYLPYEIGDTCYIFAEGGTLARCTIKTIVIGEKTVVTVESNDLANVLGLDVDISRIYPTKAIAKQELMKRSMDYVNLKLEDL